MKTGSDFPKWLQSVVSVVFAAWLSWISLGMISLQEDMRVVKYKLFGNVADTIKKSATQQAAAGLLPLPERKK